jgi:adenine phosphoribosyltransferase
VHLTVSDNLPLSDYIRNRIRTVPDWPQPGVMFRDITPLLADPKTFRILIDIFVHRFMDERIDVVAGIDARGFILGSVIAYELNRGFIPIRKKGKLPFDTLTEQYELEYGSAAVQVHSDALDPGSRVLLIDDLIATGGTMQAAVKLLSRLGADEVLPAVIIDLPDLGGSKAMAVSGAEPFVICSFAGH